MKQLITFACSILLTSTLLLPCASEAQTPVKIRGRWHTDIAGGVLDLSLARIKNTASYGSGSLKLEVFATKRKYRGKAMSAYRLASLELPWLEGRASYLNLRQQLPLLTMPPAGRYYVVLVLMEIQEMGDAPAEWAIIDWSNSYNKGWIG